MDEITAIITAPTRGEALVLAFGRAAWDGLQVVRYGVLQLSRRREPLMVWEVRLVVSR